MKANRETQEDKLQRLLDNRKHADDVENLLNETDQLGMDLKMIRETDSLLRTMKTENPSEGFASRVMHHLDDVKFTKALNMQAILLFAGVLLCLIISGLLINSVNTDSLQLPGDLNVIGQDVKIDKVTGFFNPELIMKGLMLITFFCAMLIFDRAVLRPFFQKRKVA